MQTVIRNQGLYISGVIGVHTLNDAAYRQFVTQCAGAEIGFLDFSGVEKADSAGISLMLTALRARAGKPLAVRNLPDTLRALVELYEIQDWIHSDETPY